MKSPLKTLALFIYNLALAILTKTGSVPAPVVMLEVKENAIDGRLRVYVLDHQLSRTLERLTGTRTLRPRHIAALSQVGFRFAIDRTEAQTVPVWLCKWIGVQLA